MRIEWLVDLEFAVGFRRVICALVEGFKFITAGCRDAEGAALGALQGEEGS